MATPSRPPTSSLVSPCDASGPAGLTVPLIPSSNGQHAPAFRLKLHNKSNQLLLCRLQVSDKPEGPFRFRPTNVAVLAPDDVQPFELIKKTNANLDGVNNETLKIQTAYMDKSSMGTSPIFDATSAWTKVKDENVSTSPIPISFKRVGVTDQQPSCMMALIEITDETMSMLQRLQVLSQRYPEEVWAVKVIALAVIALCFAIGFFTGSRFFTARSGPK